jgi:predicted Fe-Mo cluster-binding NifX family protein
VSGAVPTIEAAELGAGHDGRAELVLVVRYPNGAAARVRLDEEAAAQALDAAGVTQLEDLIGKAWDILARPARGG